MKARGLIVVWLVLLGGCGGCGGDDDGGGPTEPRTEIVSPGTGEPNAAPLWPIRPGIVYRAGEPSTPIYVTEPVEIGGVSMLRMVRDGRPTGFFEPGPVEPAFVKYLSVAAEGVLFHGKLREGLFAAPVLLVPAEVRLGMKWIARTDGDEPRFVFEVIDKQQELTLFGEGTTWTIAVDDRSLLATVASPEGADYQVTYFEGRGPIRGLPFSMGENLALASVIVPLDPSTRAAPARPRLALEPMLGGDPALENVAIQRLSFIEDAATYGAGALMTAYVIGAALTFVDPDGGVGYQDEAAVYCTIVRDAGLAAPPGDGCSEAGGVAVAAGGGHAQIITGLLGLVYPPDVPCEAGNCSLLGMLGIYQGEDGVRVLARNGDETLFGAIDAAQVRDNIAIDGIARVKGVLGTLQMQQDQPMWMATEAGDDLLLGIPQLGGRAFGRVEPGGVVRAGHAALALDGPIHTTARPGEQVWLTATPDGLVDRVHLTTDGIELEPLAQLELPPGGFVVGATVDDDRLIVAVTEGFLGYDTQYDPVTGERDGSIAPDFGATYLYQTALPPAQPHVAPASMVTATPMSRDVKVCWSPGAGPPDLDASHWSFGQNLQPMRVVPAGDDGNCVLLVRQTVQILVDQPGQWVIEGPIPGVGRVAIALDPLDQLDRGAELASEWPENLRVAPFLAPLAGGGLATDFYLYGPGATVARSHGELVALYNPKVDLAGAGLWHPLPGATPPRVMLQGRERQTFALPGAEESFVSQATFFGSGAVVGHGTTIDGVLTPDGTLTPLSDVSDLNLLWVTADATVCGTLLADGTALRCRDASGAEVATDSWQGDQVLGWGTGGRIYGLDALNARLSIYTPQAGGFQWQQVSLDQYGLTAATGFIQAPDGKAYLYQEFPPALPGGDFRHVLIDLDDALTSTANLISYLDLSAYLIGKVAARVVAEADLLTIFPDTSILGLPRVIRVPRP